MVIYYILFFSIVVLGIGLKDTSIGFRLIHHRRITLFPIMVFILISLVEGLRSDVIGPDTWAYKDYFVNFFSHGWDFGVYSVTDELEIGFKVLNLIVADFTTEPQVLIFVISVLIVGALVSFLWKTSSDFLISILLFFGLNHFNTSMISLRQYLAMGIVLWAYPLLKDKKYKSALSCMILGILFHQSAILFCVGLIGGQLLKKWRKSVWIVFAIEMLALPFTSVFLNIFRNVFEKYFLYYYNDANSVQLGKIPLILAGLKIIFLIYISLSDKFKSDEEITFEGIMISTSVFFSFLPIPYAWRMAFYFDFFLLLIIPDIFIKDRKHTENIMLVKTIISVLCLVMFTYYLFTGNDFIPYKFYWQASHYLIY